MSRTLLALFFLTGCADETAPRFGAGALEVSPTTDAVTLSWPAAEDDEAVDRVAVRVDGEEVASLAGDARGYVHEGLDDDTPHRVEVQAYDAAGNGSWVLRTTTRTLDETPPSWPADAELTVTVEEREGDEGVLAVAWPEAEGGAVRYRIARTERIGPELDAGERVHRYPRERLTATRITVSAADAAENWSEWLSLDWTPPEAEPPPRVARVTESAAAGEHMLILGALGSSGSFEDVLAGGAVTDNAADVLRDAEGIGVAGE